MARKNPVPLRDIEIGKRLAEAREDCLVTQSALAKRIGVLRESLVSYEKGNVPLKFWTGIAACKILDINQTWLATNVGPFKPFISFDEETAKAKVSSNILFSNGYDDYLKSIIEHESLLVLAKEEIKHWSTSSLYELYESVALVWFNQVQRGYEGEFVLRLAKAAKKILKELNESPPKPWMETLKALDPIFNQIAAEGGVDEFLAKFQDELKTKPQSAQDRQKRESKMPA